ncbi:MAG: NAD(P)/FAD-dependent oxidoreductase [Acidimicrobiales bacterium]
MSARVRVVIVGGSFAGLTTAVELRRHLDEDRAEITLISNRSRFTFIPSLTWVATGSRRIDQISFDLESALANSRVNFVNDAMTSIDVDANVVITEQSKYPYDFVVIATGHRSANEAVDGLGPFDGPGHSPMSPREAEELSVALNALLKEPAPVVVGAAPGASCIGPAYELTFEIDHILRRRKLRHLVPISFVTPEPYLGHMGMGGAGKIRQFLEGEFEERDIRYRTSVAVTKVADDSVEVDGSDSIPSALSIVIPPLAGVDAVAKSEQIANPKGFVPVDQHYRHPEVDRVYAVGVAVAMAPVESTPVPVNFPKTGHMTEQMARVAAEDIAARVDGREGSTSALGARCILDMGGTAAFLSVNPVRPPRNDIPKLSVGYRWLLAKRVFERTYLFHASRGRRMPTTLGW